MNATTLKVLLVAYACEPNKGSEPGVGWNWAVHLSKYVQVTVITRANNKSVIEKELKHNSYSNLNFIYYDIPIMNKIKKIMPLGVKMYYLIWVRSLRKFLKKNTNVYSYDIIHFVTFNTFLIPPPIYSIGIKSVWGPIGGGILGHLESFRKISKVEFIKELLRNSMVQLIGNSKKYRNLLFKYSMLIFANSDTANLLGFYSKKDIKLELDTGINSDKIHLKYNNNDLEKNKNICTLLAAGVLETRKGYHLLIDALKLVKSNLVLNILGDGNLKDYLLKYVKNKQLKNINFVGWVDYKEITQYYRDSDIFVFPSLRDTSGNVVLEAMSQGVPVIAFDHQGMHDILTDEYAIKIPVTDYQTMVNELAKAIDNLAENPELRDRMGKAANQRIKECYLWENKARRMVEIYKGVLNENTADS